MVQTNTEQERLEKLVYFYINYKDIVINNRQINLLYEIQTEICAKMDY